MEVVAIEIVEFSIFSTGNLLWPSLGDNHPLFTLLIILGVAKIFHPSLTSDLTAAHLNCLLAGSPN